MHRCIRLDTAMQTMCFCWASCPYSRFSLPRCLVCTNASASFVMDICVYLRRQEYLRMHSLGCVQRCGTDRRRNAGRWWGPDIPFKCTPCSVFIGSFDLPNHGMLTLVAAGVSLLNLWGCWRQRWSVRCLSQLRTAGEWKGSSGYWSIFFIRK